MQNWKIFLLFFLSYINQRNRERNIREAEEAFKVEVAEMKVAKADPFTRRACRPTLVTKVQKYSVMHVLIAPMLCPD